MATITVPFEVLAKGFHGSGNFSDGYTFTVPYLVAWADAFTFIDQAMGSTSATVIGPVTLHLGLQFPGSTAPIYASSFDLEPIGQNGRPLAPTYGLKPGEFFELAVVTLTFKTLPYLQQSSDDPGNLQQLDPENPLTLCEQSIKFSGKMVSRKGSGYVFSDGTMLAGDVAVPEKETRLSLKFPRVPYLPWQLVQNYVGQINQSTIFQCPPGTLLCEGGESQFTSTTGGLQGQMFVLEFTYQPYDWNMIYRPDTGRLDSVYQAGGVGDNTKQLFTYADFSGLFAALQTNAAGG